MLPVINAFLFLPFRLQFCNQPSPKNNTGHRFIFYEYLHLHGMTYHKTELYEIVVTNRDNITDCTLYRNINQVLESSAVGLLVLR
jgi:hypothetical protein